jgi:hypothetical protein
LCWRRLPPMFWAALLGLIVMMATTRLSAGGFLRVPDEPRYIYPEAFLLLIALGALAAALRLPSWAMWVGSAVLLVSLWPNIDRLHDVSLEARQTSDGYRAKWSAVEVAGANARPGFLPDALSSSAGGYLAAVRAFGSGGYSASALADRPNGARYEADLTLVGALGLGLTPADGPAPTGGAPPRLESPPGGATATAQGCLTVAAIGGGQPLSATAPSVKIVLPVGGAWIGPGPLAGAQFSIGKFTDRPSIPITLPAGRHAAALRIPPDGTGVPWRMQIQSRRPITLCGLAPKAGP